LRNYLVNLKKFYNICVNHLKELNAKRRDKLPLPGMGYVGHRFICDFAKPN